MKILVDIDGVICQYDFPALAKKYFGVEIPNDGIWTYSIEDSLGVSREAVGAMFDKEAFSPANFIPGAREALATLLTENWVLLYTHRLNFMSFPQLKKWVWEQDIPNSGIIGDVNTANNAFDGFDIHIDDSPAKLMELGSITKEKLLFDSPWNRQCLNITGQMTRVNGWGDVMTYVETVKKTM